MRGSTGMAYAWSVVVSTRRSECPGWISRTTAGSTTRTVWTPPRSSRTVETSRLGSTASAPPGPTSSSLANSVTSGASVRTSTSAVADPTSVNGTVERRGLEHGRLARDVRKGSLRAAQQRGHDGAEPGQARHLRRVAAGGGHHRLRLSRQRDVAARGRG